MKELTTEQKAQRYDEAIERLRNAFYDNSGRMCEEYRKAVIRIIEPIFPELKESEDERIRKWLIALIKSNEYGSISNVGKMPCPKLNVLAWLERQGEHQKFRDSIQVGDKVTRNKDGILVNLSQLNRVAKKDNKQGEQKPTGKVELKFKVGDFITNGVLVGKIDAIHERGYHAYFGDYYADVSDVENWHEWTIQDAKDGDVLAVEWNQDNDVWEKILIFKALNDKGVEGYGNTFKNKGLFFTDEKVLYYSKTWTKTLHPATKEQRDTLERAMTDAGYTFDFEKKELKKIEQKSAWSEEDEWNLNSILSCLKHCQNEDTEAQYNGNRNVDPKRYETMSNWLKSLKERYTWKPSDEQMDTLEQWLKDKRYNGDARYCYPIIDSLYQDLKRLIDKKG